MSVSEKQTAEIVRVLYRGANILILDEPTAVLTPQETARLFDILRRMRDKGCAIVIITHKLNEVMEISDRVTILRKGKSIATVETKNTSPSELTEWMVGQPVSLSIDRPDAGSGEALLKVVDLTVQRPDKTPALTDVGFTLRAGEILGVAGVSGSGQKELCEAIAGLQPVLAGAILHRKENIVGMTPAQIIARGIGMSFVPEDRLGMGLVASMGMTDNMLLKSYRGGPGPFLNKTPARELAAAVTERLDVKTPGPDVPVKLLSGGNVQKVLLGREISSAPNLLIVAYPVRGLDIHSSYTIYELLNEQKHNGVAVLFVGEDLDVLLELSDRILVLCNGRVSGVADARTATKEQIGLMMAGAGEAGGEQAV